MHLICIFKNTFVGFFSPGFSEEFLQADEHSPRNCTPLQSQLTVLSNVAQWESRTQATTSHYISLH